jgi:hypothetical protein
MHVACMWRMWHVGLMQWGHVYDFEGLSMLTGGPLPIRVLRWILE